jgi:hypothetical protein
MRTNAEQWYIVIRQINEIDLLISDSQTLIDFYITQNKNQQHLI